MRLLAVALIVLCARIIAAQGVPSGLEFDVASLKRNTGSQSPLGSPSFLPSGEVRLINVPLWLLVGSAYPGATVPVRRERMPSWGDETYDLIAKTKPNASPNERAQMFRALMAQRAKLIAHVDIRPQAGYKLVFARADHRLGPSLTLSTLDCSSPPPPSASFAASNQCGLHHAGQTVTSDGTTMTQLVRSLSAWIGQPITDETGLDGRFALTLVFQHGSPRGGRSAPPDDPPSVFTAIQEQLGLKLEPTTVDTRVLVIDHIERPSEN